tara:strand:- start:165 stop:464 length:300 start_codon:yes stop_codon:yes gene_type:complete
MTTPILYILSVLNNLSAETQLLEACEWDEDRLEYVRESLEKCMASYLESNSPLDEQSLLTGLNKALLENINEKEAGACIFILREAMSSFLKSDGDKYEN